MTDTKLADMLDRALDAAAREFKDRTADLDLLAAKWADITAKLTEAVITQGRTTTALIELAGERIQAHARMLTVLASAE